MSSEKRIILESKGWYIKDSATSALTEKNKKKIYSWVSDTDTLKNISGIHQEKLTEKILFDWIKKSKEVLFLFNKKELAGFATLSEKEWTRIPKGWIELCHLIVDPNSRRRNLGSVLFDSACSIADASGYTHVCGRIEKENYHAVKFVRSLRLKEMNKKDPNCRWFMKKL